MASCNVKSFPKSPYAHPEAAAAPAARNPAGATSSTTRDCRCRYQSCIASRSSTENGKPSMSRTDALAWILPPSVRHNSTLDIHAATHSFSRSVALLLAASIFLLKDWRARFANELGLRIIASANTAYDFAPVDKCETGELSGCFAGRPACRLCRCTQRIQGFMSTPILELCSIAFKVLAKEKHISRFRIVGQRSRLCR